ncbi:hypothetical protein [Pandoraea sputorum]|uniref:hypothetical protein n=1 Tax=Pandoraea sputorum TaxID=93222 RepID=UPI002F401629
MTAQTMCEQVEASGTQSLARYAFVEVKAFGDLTVTAKTLRNLPEVARERCTIVVAPHLSDLVKVLRPGCAVETLTLSDGRLPAVFDLKSRGLTAGMLSAFSLRRALSGVATGATLVMPRFARRERFIAGARRAVDLPSAENIYLAQEKFVERYLNMPPAPDGKIERPGKRRIALCPYSRVAAKNVPSELVVELVAACESSGLEIELLLLEGEPHKKSDSLNVRVIPRRFDALAAAMDDYAGVISADSLPAHLAEYCGVPAFVVSPVPNCYWLPAAAFKNNRWGVFGQRPELFARLECFLDTVRS